MRKKEKKEKKQKKVNEEIWITPSLIASSNNRDREMSELLKAFYRSK